MLAVPRDERDGAVRPPGHKLRRCTWRGTGAVPAGSEAAEDGSARIQPAQTPGRRQGLGSNTALGGGEAEPQAAPMVVARGRAMTRSKVGGPSSRSGANVLPAKLHGRSANVAA